ncbi:MAG: HD domain-containing phosphohydrolase [Armatimonadota bacterium]
MLTEPKVSEFDLVMSISEAVDLVNPALFNHHMSVAYIAFRIAAEIGLPEEEQGRIVLAGALHDVGALSIKERLNALDFDEKSTDIYRHAEAGYILLNDFEPLRDIAKFIRFHHAPWNKGEGAKVKGEKVPLESHIIHLADRISVLIKKDREIFTQVKEIVDKILEQSDVKFKPELVEAFKNLAGREYFWMDVTSPAINMILARRADLGDVELNFDSLINLTGFFSKIVDFRSHYTATHSNGVAAVAEALAKLYGYSEMECKMIKVAGYLHDLGKLILPLEVLEKSEKLTEEELAVARKHPYYTYRILERIKGLDVINTWASFHHEFLDGTGYPFHVKGDYISMESRIMAIAEVFVAVMEDSPYSKGKTPEETIEILQKMSDESKLDPTIIKLLREHFDEVNSIRIEAQSASEKEYKRLVDAK